MKAASKERWILNISILPSEWSVDGVSVPTAGWRLPGEAALRAGGGVRAVLGGAGSWEALLCLALEDTVAVNHF